METANAHPFRLLLADDDEDDRDFFRDALDELNFDTSLFTVKDGIELIRLLFTVREVPLPHLIFLDLNMPGKSGKDCLREIRSEKTFAHIPVIIFSTSINHRDVEETYRNGANLYIQKPSGFGLMVSVLDKVLRMARENEIYKTDRSRFLFS